MFTLVTSNTFNKEVFSLRVVLKIIAVITTFFAILGLFYYISPTLFLYGLLAQGWHRILDIRNCIRDSMVHYKQNEVG